MHASNTPSAPLMLPTDALTLGFEMSREAAVLPGSRAGSQERLQLRQGLSVAGLHLMIHYEDGSELADVPQVFRLPHSPTWFRGMCNLHGALIPLISLDDYLDVADHQAQKDGNVAKTMMLVLGHGADAVGMLIDGLPRRLRFATDSRIDDAAVPEALAGCIANTYWIDGQSWMDFVPTELLDRLESELKQ